MTLIRELPAFTTQFQLTRSRGAWRFWRKRMGHGKEFQLTRSRGAWPWGLMNADTYYEFQLTRSRGAWHGENENTYPYIDFNSHAHVERDTASWLNVYISALFQLTRSRGAWPGFVGVRFGNAEFQLTRSRGAWRVFAIFVKFFTNFNSHAHVERDIQTKTENLELKKFQLTRSRGAWLSS